MKRLLLFCLSLLVISAHAQTAGVDCIPIQNRDWSGCAPIDNGVQQPQVLQTAPEIWEDHYGAIATDANIGAMGASADMPDLQSAENLAITDCQAKGGKNCIVQISYGNQCVAMVVGGKIFNVNYGATIAEASKKGLEMCAPAANDCHVYYSACSMPLRIQ